MIFMGFDDLKIDDKGRVKLKVYPFKCYNKPSIKKKTRKQLIAERIVPPFYIGMNMKMQVSRWDVVNRSEIKYKLSLFKRR